MHGAMQDVHQASAPPIALEALQWTAALFALESEIRGRPPDYRVEAHHEQARSLLDQLRVSRRLAVPDQRQERAGAGCTYTTIETAKMNGIDPQAYLADILARIADHPSRQIDALLPWRWKPLTAVTATATASS